MARPEKGEGPDKPHAQSCGWCTRACRFAKLTFFDCIRRVKGSIAGVKRGLSEIKQRGYPWAHRLFICLALVELVTVAAGLFVTSFQTDSDRYEVFLWVLSMCGAIFLFYFACDAVAKENVVQIWIFAAGSLLLTARLWLVFSMKSAPEATCLVVSSVVQVVCLALTYYIIPDFGRHVFYKVGGRMRLVGLYKRFQIWLALLKADMQFSLILLIIAQFYFDVPPGVAVGSATLFVLTLGLALCSVFWVQREMRRPVIAFASFSLIQPIIYVIGIVRLNEDQEARSLLEEEAIFHESLVGGSLFNATGVSPEERALILVNATASVCLAVRGGMLVALFVVFRGFGGGLSEALLKEKEQKQQSVSEPRWGGWLPGGFPELPHVMPVSNLQGPMPAEQDVEVAAATVFSVHSNPPPGNSGGHQPLVDLLGSPTSAGSVEPPDLSEGGLGGAGGGGVGGGGCVSVLAESHPQSNVLLPSNPSFQPPSVSPLSGPSATPPPEMERVHSLIYAE